MCRGGGKVKRFGHKTIFSAVYRPWNSRDLNWLSHKQQRPIGRELVRGWRCFQWTRYFWVSSKGLQGNLKFKKNPKEDILICCNRKKNTQVKILNRIMTDSIYLLSHCHGSLGQQKRSEPSLMLLVTHVLLLLWQTKMSAEKKGLYTQYASYVGTYLYIHICICTNIQKNLYLDKFTCCFNRNWLWWVSTLFLVHSKNHLHLQKSIWQHKIK